MSFSRYVRSALFLVVAPVLLALAPGASMPSFDGATGWIGTAPITADQLHGKVVLVDFWEYTCLNCLRTLPYLREWYSRYHDDGLEIIGVQTPEFAFSGESGNVKTGMSALHVTWPVVLDDRLALWHRFGVNAWPTEMLFDQSGQLVYTHVGEGNYPDTEAAIQKLLLSRNPHLTLPKLMGYLPQDNYVKPGAVCYPDTAEILMEDTRVADEPQDQDPGSFVMYRDPGGHKDGKVYLDGNWNPLRQAVEFQGGNGYFDLPYHAIEVTVVMTTDGGSDRVDVTQDGKPIAHEDAGADLRYDASGKSYVMVSQSRAYELIMNAKFGNHDLQLAPHDGGLRIYDADFESCEVPK